MSQLNRCGIPAVLAALALAVLVVFAPGRAAQAQDLGDELGDESAPDVAPAAEPAADEPAPEKTRRRSSRRWDWEQNQEMEGEGSGTVPRDTGSYGQSDHDSVVGHAGVGFFGVVSLPMTVGVLDPDTGIYTADYTGEIAAPTIGMRFWASDLVGIEFGLGVGVSTGVFEQETAGVTRVNDPPAFGGGVAHLALPLAAGDAGHFVFEVIPEIDVGFGAGTIFGSVASADMNLRGFLIQVGARVGGEVHFGFIGVPQLALQGTIGLHLRSEHRSSDGPGNDSTTSTTLAAGTSVEQNPWDFFISNVNAIYYFP
jgi:hypothetical protein